MASRSASRAIGAVVPVAAIALWQVFAWCGLLRYEYLPTPDEVTAALVMLIRDGELVGAVAHTLGVALAAAAAALGPGTALGLAIGLRPRSGRHVMASIDVARTIPAVALLPAAVLAFGPTAKTELVLAVYAAMWPVVVTTAGAVASVHPRQHDLARMMHLSPEATVRKIVIPSAVPAWLAGARLAVVIALLVAIVAEMLLYPRGLGGKLIESFNGLAPERMWAYALASGVVGYALSAGLRCAVGKVVPGGRASVPSAVSQPAAPISGLLPLLALLTVWQLSGHPRSLVLPPPTQWLVRLSEMGGDGVLVPALTETLTTYALGLATATLIGVLLGMAIGFSHRLDDALSPSIDFLAAVPAAALLPVAVLLLGPGQAAGVAVVAVIVAWPVLLNVAAAARSVPAVRLDMSRTLGLPWAARWLKIRLPSLAPGVLLGLRVASALALIVTLLVDIFGTGSGMGRLLVQSQQTFDAAAAWGLLMIVGVFGYLSSVLFRRLSDVLPTGQDQIIAVGDTVTPISRAPANSRLVS